MLSSDQIYGKFKLKGEEYVFKIGGRGTSVLGRKQGDHVTAYALIKNGIVLALRGIEVDVKGAIIDPREQRTKLYTFISALGILDTTNQERLYNGINKVLEHYNTRRFKKTDLDYLSTFSAKLSSNDIAFQKEIKAFQTKLEHNITRQKSVNHEFICDALSQMSEVILTFYNHIPKTSFLQIKSFEAPPNEGEIVKKALRILEAVNNDPQQRRYTLDHYTASICNLFHYPKITNPDLLRDHEQATQKLATTAQARNNNLDNLVELMVRHLYIISVVFPNIPEKLQKGANKVFIKKVAKDWEIPTRQICEDVVFGLSKLQTEFFEKHYTQNQHYAALVSSPAPPKWSDIVKDSTKTNGGKPQSRQ